MSIVSDRFEAVVQTVAERTADLLSTSVIVVDDRGSVVARGGLESAGAGLDHVRVPVQLRGRGVEVTVAQPRNSDAIPPRLAQALVELVIQQAVIVDRLPNQHELKNKLIHDLLHGAVTHEAAILREAQVLGMDLAAPRAVLLIDASEYIRSGRTEPAEPEVRRRSLHVISTVVGFFNLPTDAICGYMGNGEVAVLKASTTRDLSNWLRREDQPDQSSHSWANLSALKRAADHLLARLRSDTRSSISIGIGRYHPGLHGLASSYQDARAALSLGLRFHGSGRVHCLDSLGIPAFIGLSDERTKVDLATYLLGPLDHWPELLETLEVYFQHDCSPAHTTARLSIHRNTLAYRLDRVASLTGLDPRRFDDAVQIRLALSLRSLQVA